MLAPSQARLEHARVLLDLGAALRAAGQRTAAREPLLEGLTLAARCGAKTLERRARAELAAIGVRPRTTDRSGADSLTPSEQRVVELAAAGATNRAIAQALFVTEKTVETHLGRAFRKLDVSSRRQLPDVCPAPSGNRPSPLPPVGSALRQASPRSQLAGQVADEPHGAPTPRTRRNQLTPLAASSHAHTPRPIVKTARPMS